MGTSKNSFSAKLAVAHRHSSLLKVAKSIQAEYRDSKPVCYHDRGAEADAEGINNVIMDALRHHCGSVIQTPSKLGCVTLTLHGFGHFSLLLPLFSQILYEGSLSLSAEAQVFVFLARSRSIPWSQTNF